MILKTENRMRNQEPGTKSCLCMNPPFDYRDYEEKEIGRDETNGRFGEVTLKTCKHCGALWLHYFVEYEAFTASGRWYRGLINEETAQKVTPENAIEILGSLEWHFVGGSYVQSTGFKSSGDIDVDL